MATWLAGYIIKGQRSATAGLRQELLQMHLAAVEDLVPINSMQIHGSKSARTAPWISGGWPARSGLTRSTICMTNFA